jgi:hypothetical protein
MLCGMFGAGNATAEEDSDTAKLMFLEYLGSWDESDADWMLFASEASDDDAETAEDADVSAPEDEKLVELDDEI